MTNALEEARRLAAGKMRVGRVGFEAPVLASPETVAKVEQVVSKAVREAHAAFARRVAADPPRSTWTGPASSGDDLRKRAGDAAVSTALSDVEARREGAALGKV